MERLLGSSESEIDTKGVNRKKKLIDNHCAKHSRQICTGHVLLVKKNSFKSYIVQEYNNFEQHKMIEFF